ncbi:NAD-dependent epimerase/dehydratase family protein [Mangrovibacterium marinum]|uniref:Nucleoside-diphosphate-sugar epimerase n=1 Tax=Mangrovibacterium marinum TaxID=1639118 RepID=A0A2T5C2U1_9BACT|nr:NAD-dependent epimerase/dehydratase family protein [Mangrovibacterium marinum]PTN09054.1 nucleoside-diphosphate-sugar epimerase [Mangrovibacterium marinum]
MIFVTGGTGLVGSHLLFNLLQTGNKVRALKRPNSNMKAVIKSFSYYTDKAEELFQQIEWVEGDILDYHSLEDLLNGVTDVYHCAAMVSFHPNDHDSMLNNNVKGTANLIDAAIVNKVKRFCHISSIAALGKTQDGTLIDEETYWIPSKQKSAYSLSKFFSEMEVWRGIEEGVDAVIVNPSIILGPGNWDIGSPKLFQTIWKGLKYYTKGETGFVDVRDVVRAMAQLMEARTFEQVKNQRFILNAGNMSYQDFFNQIADALQRPRPKTFASDLILKIAWRAARLASFFSGKRPAITRETVSGSNNINHYNGSKIQRSIDFSYHPLNQTIVDIAQLFLQDVEQLTPGGHPKAKKASH